MPTDDGATALEQQDVRTPCQDEFGGLANELKTAIQRSAAALKRAAGRGRTDDGRNRPQQLVSPSVQFCNLHTLSYALRMEEY